MPDPVVSAAFSYVAFPLIDVVSSLKCMSSWAVNFYQGKQKYINI